MLWLFFISVIFQAHLGLHCLQPSCQRNQRRSHAARYCINLQHQKYTEQRMTYDTYIYIYIIENVLFKSLVWGSLTPAPIRCLFFKCDSTQDSLMLFPHCSSQAPPYSYSVTCSNNQLCKYYNFETVNTAMRGRRPVRKQLQVGSLMRNHTMP